MTPQELKRQLQSLEEHPGYLALSQSIQDQVDRMQKSILFERCRSIDDALGKEYEKGQLEGRLSIEGTRKAMIDGLSIDINRSIEDGHSRESDDGNDSGGNQSP